MDNEDVLLLLVCVVVDGTKAEAEEMKASARMLESFMIAIGRCIVTELCGLLSIAIIIIIVGRLIESSCVLQSIARVD